MRTTTRASDPPMAAEPLLAADGIEFSYGHQQVLFGVSVQVHEREAVTLLGTNGAGKYTLMRCIAGLERPSAGRVIFQGDDITGRAADEIVRTGLVLVNGGHAVFADMTVQENLEIKGLLVHRRRGE